MLLVTWAWRFVMRVESWKPTWGWERSFGIVYFWTHSKPTRFANPYIRKLSIQGNIARCAVFTLVSIKNVVYRHVISFVSFYNISGKPYLSPPTSQMKSVHEVPDKMPVNFYRLQKTVFVWELRLSQRCCWVMKHFLMYQIPTDIYPRYYYLLSVDFWYVGYNRTVVIPWQIELRARTCGINHGLVRLLLISTIKY